MQAETHFKPVDSGPVVHVLKLKDLKNFAFLAVTNESYQAFIGFLGNELVGIGTFLKEDLNDWIQTGLHDSLEVLKHILYRHKSYPTYSRPEAIR